MTYYVSRFIFWLIIKVYLGYRVKYRENFPAEGPFIIASNHLSFLDPALVGNALRRRVSFLAREDLFKNRIFNLWGRAVGAIPVKRGRFDLSAMKGSLQRLKKGEVVALFPEGTRSVDGFIREAKAGVGFLAVKAGVPIVPLCIKGTDKALPKGAIFIRLKPVAVYVGKPVAPERFLKANGEYDYQALSQEAMKRVEEFRNNGS